MDQTGRIVTPDEMPTPEEKARLEGALLGQDEAVRERVASLQDQLDREREKIEVTPSLERQLARFIVEHSDDGGFIAGVHSMAAAHGFEEKRPVPETDGDVLSRLGTDGEKWAEEFITVNAGKIGLGRGDVDLDVVRAWFANAIEAGRSAGQAAGGSGTFRNEKERDAVIELSVQRDQSEAWARAMADAADLMIEAFPSYAGLAVYLSDEEKAAFHRAEEAASAAYRALKQARFEGLTPVPHAPKPSLPTTLWLKETAAAFKALDEWWQARWDRRAEMEPQPDGAARPERYEPMSAERLHELLDGEIATAVLQGDSFEGFIEYVMPGPLAEALLPIDPQLAGRLAEADFAVRASYRVGNSIGQGGCVMIPQPDMEIGGLG